MRVNGLRWSMMEVCVTAVLVVRSVMVKRRWVLARLG